MEIQNALYCLSPVDRISDLPWPILDNILGRVPIKYAVRTSILSRQWRDKWVNLSKLVFDDSCLSYRGNVDLLVNFMYRFMLSHCGQIDSFKLSTCNKPEFSDFDNWIRFLSRNGTKELTLEYPYSAYGVTYKMSSRLFSCQQLTHLHIMNSLLEPPITFHGFRNLVHLQLKGYVNKTEVLANLVHDCPVLERLVLTDFKNLARFNIKALKLKYLFLEGILALPIVLEDCPALAEISFLGNSSFTFDEYEVQDRICHLIKDLSRLNSLKSLKISNWFVTYLTSWDKSELPYGSSNQFTVLELNELYLGDLTCAFVILTLFSNLQKLYISVDHIKFKEADFLSLQVKTRLRCTLNQLHSVEIRLSRGDGDREDGYKAELEFIKFVLSHSPVLKKMTIVSNDNIISSQTALMIELLSLERASAAARIVFRTSLN